MEAEPHEPVAIVEKEMNMCHPAKEKGFSLIEILVTMVVLSLGLLGIAALQTLSIKRSQSALFHSIAVSQASDIAERMRTNQVQLDNYILALSSFSGAGSGATCSSACALSDVVGADASAWIAGNSALLPRGKGVVCHDDTPDDGDLGDPSCDGGGRVVIKVFWDDSRSEGRASKASGSSDNSQRYVMSFLL